MYSGTQPKRFEGFHFFRNILLCPTAATRQEFYGCHFFITGRLCPTAALRQEFNGRQFFITSRLCPTAAKTAKKTEGTYLTKYSTEILLNAAVSHPHTPHIRRYNYDQTRHGTKAAGRILRSGTDVIEIEDDKMYPGALPGINMAIKTDGKTEGVLGVTGEPDRIREVAMVIRLAIEAMLKYEREQERLILRRGNKAHFIYLLTRVENTDPSELRAEAKRLGYEESVPRIPILCRIFDGTDPHKVHEQIRGSRKHGPQDMSDVIDETHVLVFKAIPVANKARTLSCRPDILSYLDGAVRQMDQQNIHAVFYVGTMQTAFSQYFDAFRHCKWLETNAPASDRVVFFQDHASRFFSRFFYDSLPTEELHRVFHQYRIQLRGEDRAQLLETAGALIDANFNLTEAAKILYIHKNTMVYRYNKLKDLLRIDPLQSSADRSFLTLLWYSLR